jgi:alkylation response protein AidB-like acyl-CoA dehydrogenase
MTVAFPSERATKRRFLLDAVDSIGKTLRASGPHSEELGTLAPDAVEALIRTGMLRLKLAAEMGGAEADPVTEMMVLEALAYHDLTSGWCTMVGATAIASLGTFLPPAGLEKVFKNGHIPTAAISFFPAGRAVRDGKGYRVNGRWRFNSGIHHAEWVLGGTVVEGSEAENGGRPIVMFSAFPIKDVTIHDNWGGVVGLRGTGSCDFSVENYHLPEDLTFVWDLLKPKPRRGGPSYLLPPFSYVAKEHGSVAIGAARRALDELIQLATTTRGTFRSSRLDERQVVHRFIAQADLKLRAARALMHERYDQLYDSVGNGRLPDGADIADVRAIAVHATDVAIETATTCYHFAGNTGLHHPHVMGRLLRDLNTAGLHQVMSDTAYENHGKFRLGLPADPLA